MDWRPLFVFRCDGCGTERVGGYAFDAPNWRQVGYSVHGSRYNKWATAWFCPQCKKDERIMANPDRITDAEREKEREKEYGQPRRRYYRDR